jgi:hypothetical protein
MPNRSGPNLHHPLVRQAHRWTGDDDDAGRPFSVALHRRRHGAHARRIQVVRQAEPALLVRPATSLSSALKLVGALGPEVFTIAHALARDELDRRVLGQASSTTHKAGRAAGQLEFDPHVGS